MAQDILMWVGKRPKCFGYFRISKVTILVDIFTINEVLDKTNGKATLCMRDEFPPGDRKCGEMVVGGVYLVSDSVFEAARKNAKGTDLYGDLNVFDKPYPMLASNFSHFRGYRYINGDQFIENMKPHREG